MSGRAQISSSTSSSGARVEIAPSSRDTLTKARPLTLNAGRRYDVDSTTSGSARQIRRTSSHVAIARTLTWRAHAEKLGPVAGRLRRARRERGAAARLLLAPARLARQVEPRAHRAVAGRRVRSRRRRLVGAARGGVDLRRRRRPRYGGADPPPRSTAGPERPEYRARPKSC